MLDIGWSEMLVIAVVAIVIIGPKDLPRLLRSIGAFLRKARMTARDFQRSLEDIANEADLKDMEQEIHDRKREGRAAPKGGKKK
ncbi:MAG: twin-arginine translocase subunit TatB [Proteobacteria bacterium]|nr:twin-arginine translocase subunit TatB [Pseudomonadota bacterium]